MADVTFFGERDGEGCSREELMAGTFDRVGKHAAAVPSFDPRGEYQIQDELYGPLGALNKAG